MSWLVWFVEILYYTCDQQLVCGLHKIFYDKIHNQKARNQVACNQVENNVLQYAWTPFMLLWVR